MKRGWRRNVVLAEARAADDRAEAVGPELARCPLCDGEGADLGRMGNLRWLRCRRCGMDFNLRTDP